MRRPYRSRQRDRQEGQGLVEFALVLPVFMLLIFGLFDVGSLVFANSALSQGAREGARVAAAEAAWIGVPGPACVSDASQITAGDRVLMSVPRTSPPSSPTSPTPSTG